MARRVLNRFELARLGRTGLLTEYFREMGRDSARGGDRIGKTDTAGIRTAAMSIEGIVTTMLARREALCPSP